MLRLVKNRPSERGERLILVAIVVLYYIAVYASVLKITAPLEHYTVFSRWDRQLPLVPAFLYIYLQVYFFVFIPPILVESRALFRKDFLAYILNMSVTYCIFVIFPTMIQRPALSLDTFNEFGLTLLYRFDAPSGCFPSLHVSMAALAAIIVLRENRKLGIAAHIMAFLIGISTVLLQQHYIADVVGGYLLAGFSYFALHRRELLKNVHILPRWLNP